MRSRTEQPAAATNRRDALRRHTATFRHVFRRLLGAPDYEAYLEHCRRAGHAPRLTEREFVAQAFEAKAHGPRCC